MIFIPFLRLFCFSFVVLGDEGVQSTQFLLLFKTGMYNLPLIFLMDILRIITALRGKAIH